MFYCGAGIGRRQRCGKFLRRFFIRKCGACIAGRGHSGEAGDDDGRGRVCFADGTAEEIFKDFDRLYGFSDDENVAFFQDAVENEHGRATAARARASGFQHQAVCRHRGVRMQAFHLRHKQYGLQQFVHALAGFGADLHRRHLSAVALHQHFFFCQFLLDSFRVGAGLVGLVERYDKRDFALPDDGDGFAGLRFYPLVRRNHQNCNVGDCGAADADLGKRFVPGRVNEGKFFSVLFHLVCRDVLGDAAGLFFRDFCFAVPVQDARFSMVNVAHHDDDGRPDFFVCFARGGRCHDFCIALSNTFFSSAERGEGETPLFISLA